MLCDIRTVTNDQHQLSTLRTSASSSSSSLFSDQIDSLPPARPPAGTKAPPIPGLYIFPAILPPDMANSTIRSVAEAKYFSGGTRDQVMLFSRALSASSSSPSCISSASPAYLSDLIENLEGLLDSSLPPNLKHTVFHQPLARQVILNLYPPGTGITPHVDLPNRYADGILGVSLIGGAVMSFTKMDFISEERYDVYMPLRSVYVMTGGARWDWNHGIEATMEDMVEEEEGRVRTMLRETRLSATFRYMKEGGDVLA